MKAQPHCQPTPPSGWGWWRVVALAAAAAIAGPWPSLSTLSLGWRLPLVGLAIWVGRGVRAWQRWAIAALAVVALVVDAGFPARRTPQRVAAAVSAAPAPFA